MMQEKRNGTSSFFFGGGLFNQDLICSTVQRKVSEMKAILRELGGKPTLPRWPL